MLQSTGSQRVGHDWVTEKQQQQHDPITVFLIVLGIFYRWVFSFSCFLSREVPLAFVVKLV